MRRQCVAKKRRMDTRTESLPLPKAPIVFAIPNIIQQQQQQQQQQQTSFKQLFFL